ncbi:helix-turn-helix domain-containing protein [Microbacterium sp.]|uniref:helix-turn-helix domain-containing protein n=1 Tax=Microbacterium sp. TaxID=51671 RepID=UPI002810FB44|nr:helix-turn-helix domain-containing protein [Microbacterium sp.]
MRPLSPAPSRDPLAIGPKIRATRLGQGLTIAQVAEASGLTKGFLSRVERDETSPSVATLRAICEVLSLPIGALFERPVYEMVSLDDAPLVNMGATHIVDRLLSSRWEHRVQILRSTMPPGAPGGSDLYTVNCDIEIVHVISGALTVRLGSDRHHLVAGDTMSMPGREPHTWDNESDDTTEVIWVLVPAPWSGSTGTTTRL